MTTELDVILAKLSPEDRQCIADALWTDELTGLKNRKYFERHLAMERRKDSATYDIALVMIDIDHFKQVNDTYGHRRGDDILRSVGEIINEHTRQNDFILSSRIGGEELSVVCTDADVGNGYYIAERIRRKVELTTEVTISAGVAGLEDCRSVDELFMRADEALYAAKAGGRNIVRVYSPNGANGSRR